MAAWRDRLGDSEATNRPAAETPTTGAPGNTQDLDRLLARFKQNQDDARLEQFARPLADDFEISAIAMRIVTSSGSIILNPDVLQGRRALL